MCPLHAHAQSMYTELYALILMPGLNFFISPSSDKGERYSMDAYHTSSYHRIRIAWTNIILKSVWEESYIIIVNEAVSDDTLNVFFIE